MGVRSVVTLKLVRLVAAFFLLAIIPSCDVPINVYPARIKFSFEYEGHNYTKSYLTVVTKRVMDPIGGSYRWDHGRDKISVALPNGELAILITEWPYQLGGSLQEKTGRSSLARWVLIDDAKNPRQIVYGDRASKLPLSQLKAVKFPWLQVTEVIERVGLQFLPEAMRADKLRDDADMLVFSNKTGGGSPSYSGILFAGLDIAPIHGSGVDGDAKIEQIKKSPGWINVSEDCRFKPSPPRVSLEGLSIYSERRALLLSGETWSADGAPLPGEPAVMYSTHEQVANESGHGFSLTPYFEPTMRMVHSVEWKGMICRGLNPPSGTFGGIFEFKDGTLASIFSSGEISILRY